MNNGARVSGYIKRPPKTESGDWSKESRDRFREQWQQQYVGEGAKLAEHRSSRTA